MEIPNREKRNIPRRTLIDRYMPLIRRIVLKYNRKLPPHIDIDDLVSAGVAGLLAALDKFDPDRGVRFEGFANYYIKWSILSELRQWDHLTRRQRQTARRIEETYLLLEKEHNREPTDEEMAGALGCSLEKYHRSKALSNLTFLSYEDQWNGEGATDLLELIFSKEVRLPITRAIEKLPKKERTVIDLYYLKEHTMKETAEALEVSESRVSQLHRRAMERLAAVRKKLDAVARLSG